MNDGLEENVLACIELPILENFFFHFYTQATVAVGKYNETLAILAKTIDDSIHY
jgi:hypothetical protein